MTNKMLAINCITLNYRCQWKGGSVAGFLLLTIYEL